GELVLRGYVAFLDPPKATAARALAALHKHGVAVKILTGDNHLISRKVCKDVGLSADPMLLGGDVEKCPTRNWPRQRRRRRCSPASLRRTKSGSSVFSGARGTSWDSWATESTTLLPCERRTSASRWTPPLTSPRSRRISSCLRKISWCCKGALSRDVRSSRTSLSTSAWAQVP